LAYISFPKLLTARIGGREKGKDKLTKLTKLFKLIKFLSWLSV